ncbi:CLIP domain-containing serine protease 2-like [Culex quinquefasciatus]|uniref:CLIP domain-containing serine protease 2-like n=1 Tax=Culex quinquefasciatus TaxID=7176 RepID=UPI0018E3D77A|nr:CLIP domain-containing serine protease 2-like [Culex quinquefasciatus]
MFLRSFLLVLVFCTVIYAQLVINHCSEDKPCVDVKACDDYKVYIKRKYTNWPVWAKNRLKSHYCGRREEAGSKIYSVCCDQPVGIETRFSTPEDIVLNEEDCGKHSSDRIAFGSNARVFEYPWMALLQDKDERFICGGSLITKWHVLTAAHCKSGQV